MHRKKLDELNVIDDFLFLEMANYGEQGEEFCRQLLGIILDRAVGKVKVTAQKVITAGKPDKHGIRLDVYMEEDELSENSLDEKNKEISAEIGKQGDVFDIEMETGKGIKNRRSLPRRTRYYHSIIDRKLLNAGAHYKNLKRAYVIFIMQDDPFERGLMWYTARTQIVEDTTIPYDDGNVTIYLYTKGNSQGIRNELVELMHYIEDSCESNVKNPIIEKIHQVTTNVKRDEEVEEGYMKAMEYFEMLQEEGRELGLEEGRELGLEEGREIGLEEGRELGLEQGLELGKKIFKMHMQGKSVTEIAKECEMTEEAVEKIVNE